jgi:DNA-binding transcriptional regulator YiaG
MPNLATALKDEIRRLARKEIRAMTGKTARSVTQYRREIATLKRQLHEQDKKIASLASSRFEQAVHANTGDLNGSVRFSPRSAKAQRRRTGLSAADYGRLVGVSPITIYSWESGTSRPRKQQFASLVALRGLGKREAATKLALLKPGAKQPNKPLRRRRAKK